MENEFTASHRFARIAPRKARYVMDLVRRQPVERALEVLRFTSRRASPMIAKVIRSAIANAVQEGGADPESLVIQQAIVEVGPTLKRWRPRARGTAYPILKRTSHLNIAVKVVEEAALRSSKARGTEKMSTKGATKGGPRSVAKESSKATAKSASKGTGSSKGTGRSSEKGAKKSTEKSTKKSAVKSTEKTEG